MNQEKEEPEEVRRGGLRVKDVDQIEDEFKVEWLDDQGGCGDGWSNKFE